MNNSTINDGGPAFPVPDSYLPNDQVQYGSNGMTLRDWFAGKAMMIPTADTQDISRCDDFDLLERFGTEAEKEEGFTPVYSRESPMPVRNIELRAALESRARARLRYIEADAMIEARKHTLP